VLVKGETSKRVSLWGTDMLVFSRINIDARVKTKGIEWLVPHAIFSSYLDMWSGQVVLTSKDSKIVMECGADRVEMPMLQGVDEFKQRFPMVEGTTVPTNDLPQMFRFAQRIVPKRSEVLSMEGVHIRSRGSDLVVEGSDGHQYLQFVEAHDKIPKFSCIAHAKGGDLFSSLPPTKDGVMMVGDRFLVYGTEMGTFQVILLNAGAYPPLDDVKRKKKAKLVVDVSELALVVRKSTIIGSNVVSLEPAEGGMNVRATTFDKSLVYEGLMPAEKFGKVPTVRVSVSSLSLFLSVVGKKEIAFYMGGGNDNVWYNSPSFVFLTTPYSMEGGMH